MLRFDLCSACNGSCQKDSKYQLDIIVYSSTNKKHRFLAYKKNIKQFENRPSPHAKGILPRFGHLKGKSVRIEYFVDGGNEEKRILLNMELV